MREAQAVSSSIALPSMASYATKDPIIVDNTVQIGRAHV